MILGCWELCSVVFYDMLSFIQKTVGIKKIQDRSPCRKNRSNEVFRGGRLMVDARGSLCFISVLDLVGLDSSVFRELTSILTVFLDVVGSVED